MRVDDLGEFVAWLGRVVSPVRWVCRHDTRKTEVRLVDDTGLDDEPQAFHYSFADPTASVQVSADKIKFGFEFGGVGGLYVGVHGQYLDSLVIGTSHPTVVFTWLA